jgi:hypothetical protein
LAGISNSPFFFSGANINLPDYRGLTPLKLSKRYGQEDIEVMLEARGAICELPKEEKERCSRS